jgi:ADP-ribose pyrophosphatase YjhB (NUDIX family)
MQKIYLSNKPLIISATITREIKNYLDLAGTVFMDELNDAAVDTIINALQQPEINAGIFLYKNVEAVLAAIKEKFTVIQAAGGLVNTTGEHILLIFRKGKWDLPKGKLDEGELLEVCAVREVEEETKVQNIQLEKLITITYHNYYEKEKNILKETHWYLMYSKEKQSLTPQTEEDIEKCEWVPIYNITPYMHNAHLSIVDVVNKGLEILKKE